MKDFVFLGNLSVNLFFQLKSPQSSNLRIEEFVEGEKYASQGQFERYLDFISHIGRKVWQCDGGPEASLAAALARAGFSIGFLGKLGKDKFADFLIHSLEGVDTSRVRKEGFTGVRLVLHREDSEESSLIFPNANESLRLEEIDLAYLNDTRFFYTAPFMTSPSLETQKQLMDRIAPSVRVTLRIGEESADMGVDALSPLISKSHVTFVDERELGILTGRDYREGSRELLAHGTKNVVCRIESEGWHTASLEADFLVRTSKVPESKDAGGTVFMLGFLTGMLLNKPLDECTAIGAELESRSQSENARNLADNELLEIILSERENLSAS